MKKKAKKGRVEKALDKSFINYFSDLFIVVMVLAWIAVMVIMVIMAIYATVTMGDTYMWTEVANLVAIPLSAGGAIWMVKCSVQHAIANREGHPAKMDFPRVDTEEIELEQPEYANTTGGGAAGETEGLG